MTKHAPSDPKFENKVRKSFEHQAFMNTIGATLAKVESGSVEIILPFHPSLTQQHGFIHAGVIAACLDNACGYSALSLQPAGKAVLTVEYKINLLSPAKGQALEALGRVTRTGRNLTVCHADGYVQTDHGKVHVATMLATIIAVEEQGSLRD